LDPQYEYEVIKESFNWEKIKLRPRSIWRWRELLPVEKDECVISLGEGDTPLVNCKSLAAKLGLQNLYIKNDGLNPTASLKDRSISVAVSKALEFGYRVVASDSSGNKAASMSAYAARAGILSLVFCPATTPAQKLLQILAYGGRLVIVDTDRSGLMDLYSKLIQRKEKEWYDLGLSNPFRYEGKKTYAYEIGEALGGRSPEWIPKAAQLYTHCLIQNRIVHLELPYGWRQ
jgi:threonine synthase